MSTSPASRAVPLAWFFSAYKTQALRGAEVCRSPWQSCAPTRALSPPRRPCEPGSSWWRPCGTAGPRAGEQHHLGLLLSQTSASLYEGGAGPAPPTPPCAPFKLLGGTSDPSGGPQRVAEPHHPPWIQPWILLWVFLGGRGAPIPAPPGPRPSPSALLG